MKRILLTILALSITAQAGAFSLPAYKVSAKPGETREIVVSNVYQETITVYSKAKPDTYHKDLPADAKDCSEAIKVYPKAFDIQPGEKQTVKVISRQEGYCYIFFEVYKHPKEEEPKLGASISIQPVFGIPATIKGGE